MQTEVYYRDGHVQHDIAAYEPPLCKWPIDVSAKPQKVIKVYITVIYPPGYAITHRVDYEEKHHGNQKRQERLPPHSDAVIAGNQYRLTP